MTVAARLPGADAMASLAETGFVPDALLRLGIRMHLRERLRQEGACPGGRVCRCLRNCPDDPGRREARRRRTLCALREGPVAEHPESANAQHYEAPPEFFRQVLGPLMKYSACYWPPGTSSLAEAERRMLELCAERAGLADGMRVLDLGCGWGSFALWAARRYPNSRIVAVSNSASQGRHIAECARRQGRANVEVLTRDVNDLGLRRRFDRVVSIEMFEHVRNYRELMRRIAAWLAPEGRLFVHIFCHRFLAYPFEDEGGGNWMARNFFTGGVMPARDTLGRFGEHLELEASWDVGGEHYRRTARAWLDNLDANRCAAASALAAAAGERTVSADRRALQRWRMFFMACEELFGWRGGREWQVGHFLFRRAALRRPKAHAAPALERPAGPGGPRRAAT